ncbi:MAG: helix-turn-helix domain-containing protein [Candidatus Cybelea sp.]
MRPEDIVDFAEALARISASGGGPKALAAHLAQATGAGVLLEDAQWRHVAAAGTNSIPPSGRAIVEAGAPGTASRITCGDLHLGWISLFGNDPGGDLLVRLTAAAIGVEMGREIPGRRAKRGLLWSSLLDGMLPDAGAAREEAALHGVALATHYAVVALETEESVVSPALGELRALAADAFRGAGEELGFCEREQTLFVFVPAARSVDASNARTAAGLLPRAAARRESALRICGGVGTVEPLAALARSGATAQAALLIGRRVFGSGNVVSYEALGAYPLLYDGADATRLRSFAAEVLAPIRAYDEKHQTDLERTLKLYFAVGQNIKTASERLSVHRQTIFYRLRQIGEITSRTLESPHDQLTFRMAVAIDELHT